MFLEIGLGSFLRIVRTSRSASPLEYASDLNAEGDVDVATDGSYVTPPMLSPVRPEEPIVGDAVERVEPTGDRLGKVRALVPIEEVEDVPDSESDEVPEENENPLPIREQPPAYSPVRRGQQSMRGGRVPSPHVFRRHCFPYTADLDVRPAPTYLRWEIPLAKRRRSEDESGDGDCQEPILLTILKFYFSGPTPPLSLIQVSFLTTTHH